MHDVSVSAASVTRVNALKVREICGNISEQTLWRWVLDNGLGFPRPVKINGRRYWNLAEVAAWWASRQEAA